MLELSKMYAYHSSTEGDRRDYGVIHRSVVIAQWSAFSFGGESLARAAVWEIAISSQLPDRC